MRGRRGGGASVYFMLLIVSMGIRLSLLLIWKHEEVCNHPTPAGLQELAEGKNL